jgi:hypothetical protein
MKKKSSILFLKTFYLFCALFFVGSNARASFIELHDPNIPLGDGPYNITRDTQTGLEWLDIWSSRAMGYSQITSQLGSGGTFESFRFATREELETFLRNAGLTAGRNDDYGSLIEFLRLVGLNYGTPYESLPHCLPGPCFTSIWGIYDPGFAPVDNHYATAQITITHLGETGYGSVNFFTPTYPLGAMLGTEVTYWLVRDATLPAPEPTTFALLGMGLAGLGYAARRRREQQ